MSGYTLQSGEVLNGGYTVTIGGYTLRNIGGYKAEWTNVYDSGGAYTDYQGNEQKALLGRRFSLAIKTGALNATDCASLVTALKSGTIAVVCPDFTGNCYCESIPAELRQANFLGTRYGVDFTLTAKTVEAVGSL